MVDTFDAVVIGGGVMGSAALHYLAELGLRRTLLLERDTLACASTGRSMAILRTHYSNEITARMARDSRDVVARFEEETGYPGGFTETGYLLLAQPGQEAALCRNVELGRSLGIDTRAMTPEEAAPEWPDLDFSGVGAVAYEPRSGYADSSAVTTGFANRARESGAELRLGVRVTGITTEGGKATGVETTDGRVSAGAVVNTAGPWASDLLESIGAPLPLSWTRHQVVKLRRPMDRVPWHPIIADTANGQSVRPDSGDISLIGVREDPVDRDTYNRSVDPAVAAESMSLLARRMPAMSEAGWDGGWSGLFTITPDHHPVIDLVPGFDNLTVGAGFSGHGFKLAPSIGRALAELIVHGRSITLDMAPLRFTRFQEGDLMQSAYGAMVFA